MPIRFERHVSVSLCLLAATLVAPEGLAQVGAAPQQANPPPANPQANPAVAVQPDTAAATPSVLPEQATFEDNLAKLVGLPGGLTSKQVAERALSTSIQLRAAAAQVDVARANTDRVFYNSLPRVSALARYTRLSPVDQGAFGPGSGSLVATSEPSGPLAPGAPLFAIPASAFSFPQILNQYLLQATLNVPLSDYLFSTGDASEAAETNERAQELSRDATRHTTQMQAKLLYYDWVRARLSMVVAEKSVEQGQASLQTARTAFDAGRVSNADVLNAESRLAGSELAVERARTQVAVNEERLRVVMHDPIGKHYEIGEDLFVDPKLQKKKSFADLYAEAKTRRLELRSLDAAMQSLASQVHVANAKGLPKLEAFGNAYYARPNQRYIPQRDEWQPSWDVGLQLSWSPNDLGTTRSDSRILEAERLKLMAERDRLVDSLQQEVLEAYTALKEAEFGVGIAERNLIASEEAYRVLQLQYAHGRATSLALLDSAARLLQARIDVINVRVAQRMAKVVLEHAVGRDVKQTGSR
jgi:outer membrane protein TolC